MTTFSSRVKEGYVSISARIKEVHINNLSCSPNTSIHDSIPELLKMLRTTSFPQLEHCKIEISEFAARLGRLMGRREQVTLFAGHGAKLTSLYLSAVPFIPTNHSPSLIRFFVHNTHYFAPGERRHLHSELLVFLAAHLQLEELSITNAGLIVFSHPGVEAAQWNPVDLRSLHRFIIGDRCRETVALCKELLSAIKIPIGCHLHFLSHGQDPISSIPAQLVSLRPDYAAATKMRLALSQPARCIAQLAAPSSHGSLTLSFDVLVQPYDITISQHMSMTFPSLRVQELWIRLQERDYRRGNTQPLPLRAFHNLKRLVIGQPARICDPRAFERIGVLLDHITGFIGIRPGDSLTAMACPLLDTLCINLPPYVRSLRPLTTLLASREQTYPIRRVIVGYDSALELNVLAEVYGLEAYVDEFVCVKLDMASYASPTGWLMDIPEAFKGPDALHTHWPSWP